MRKFKTKLGALRAFRKRRSAVIEWAMKRIRAGVTDGRTPEAMMLLALIERALIDAFVIGNTDPWGRQARNSYLSGPVFEWHTSLLGLEHNWVLEQVASVAMSIGEIEREEREDASNYDNPDPSGSGSPISMRGLSNEA